jgi:16S rRNA (guanine966-N2)-methyltransferase
MPQATPEHSRRKKPGRRSGPVAGVRIIAGRFRGRRLYYSGDPRIRPMKDRVREALFSILGQRIEGKYVLDLFAGTGALGLEAISRGASAALFLEYHRPTAARLRENIARLGLEQCCQVLPVDTLIWFRRGPVLPTTPWAVFCSPPYDFYQTRQKDMLELIGGLIQQAPAESLFVVEADARLDLRLLPHPDQWDIRQYRPTVLAIYQKPVACQRPEG